MPLDFEPGSKFSYSNSNFEVLGDVIEKVSGKSYNDEASVFASIRSTGGDEEYRTR